MKQTIKDILLILALLLLICLSVFGQTTEEKKLIPFINEWMGVKYKFGASPRLISSKRAIDCSQFTRKIYQEIYGINIGNNCRTQWAQSKRVHKDSLEVGDVLFFRSSGPSGWHCGFYLGFGNFVHASSIAGEVTINNLEDKRYKKTYKGAGRFFTII